MATGSIGVQEHPSARTEPDSVARDKSDRVADQQALASAEPAPWRWRTDPSEAETPQVGSGPTPWAGQADLVRAFGWAKAWGRW